MQEEVIFYAKLTHIPEQKKIPSSFGQERGLKIVKLVFISLERRSLENPEHLFFSSFIRPQSEGDFWPIKKFDPDAFFGFDSHQFDTI